MDDHVINLCDLKVVYHLPPLDHIPSLFCKGTVLAGRKTFWLALYDSSLSLCSFSIKTGFIIMSGKEQVESRGLNLKLGTPACHRCSFS
jgi:hypothetical protein